MDPCYPVRRILSHQTPGWVEGPEYFITVCCRERGINHLCRKEVASIFLVSARTLQSLRLWTCELLVLMPDHFHLLVSFPVDRKMKMVMESWKRWLARRGGLQLQRGFFEHRLRSTASACEKWVYVNLNPVRQGLIEDPTEWPYRWTRNDLEVSCGRLGEPTLPGLER